MGAINITLTGMFFGFLLLIIPLGISRWLNLGLNKTTFWAILRMTVQLILVGLFLEYLFKFNNLFLTVSWLILMIVTAIFSVASKLKLKLEVIFWPLFISFIFSTLAILLYFNFFILQLDNVFEARYLIAVGGMLLGTILTTNIVVLNFFYQKLASQRKLYLYRLSLGASLKEALHPFIKEGFHLALMPMLAKTATMGIISIPGMMTGQILSGSSPMTAISYQILIMIAIYTSDVLSILLVIWLSIRNCFNGYGVMKETIFKTKK